MSLPIDDILPSLIQQLAQQPVLVLEAPPGAGKTTRVPPALLAADWLAGRKILMLEPRRLATRSAAEFMAQQRGEKVGETVGYSVRYERKTSPQTRIEVITEGILTRRLQSDPELAGVGLVIFDEFHERNIHSDIALALTNDLRKGLRADLRILVMSATLDSAPLLRLLDAGHLRSEGRSWPVEIIYQGGEINRDCVVPMVKAITRAVKETKGDILAFLPGVREIEQVRVRLAPQLAQLLICPLHGRLRQAEQQLALQKASKRKVILATNIAETSLTIDGIVTVVDSGLCRQPGFDPGSGLSRLQTNHISQASSNQRAGRAGRQSPGVCYRLWSAGAQAALLPQTPAEIRNADLAPLALALCAWGLADANQLDWLDPPPSGALAAAQQLLHQLGLTDQQDRLNADGRCAVSLPVHPRFASLLLLSEKLKVLPVGCLLAAFIGETGGQIRAQNKDFLEQLRQFALEFQHKTSLFQTANQAFKQLTKLFKSRVPRLHELKPELLSTLLAQAYPDRIAYSKQGNGDYLLTNGHGAKLRAHSPLIAHDWLVITDISQNEKGAAMIRRAFPLDCGWSRQKVEAAQWCREVFWDETKQRVLTRQVKRLGAIELRAENQSPSTEQTGQVLGEIIRTSGANLLNWTRETEQFLARIALLYKYLGSPWPEVSRKKLLQHPENWLIPYLAGISSGTQLKKFDLMPALRGLLDWRQHRELDQLVPLRIKVPSGEMSKIDYRPAGPVLAVKLQQLFGLADTPTICRGQVALKLDLLSPAGRSLAITSDLRNFWDNVYPEVQKEMKGRYPKHPWPNTPWLAQPTRKTKRSKG